MGKQIYTVFVCDQWKSWDSMRLLMATTSVRRLRSFIVRKIADEIFTYDKGDELSISQQVKLFKQDFENGLLEDINNCLHYGFLDYRHDGEEKGVDYV